MGCFRVSALTEEEIQHRILQVSPTSTSTTTAALPLNCWRKQSSDEKGGFTKSFNNPLN